MKAFLIDRYGGPDRMRAAEAPDPEVGENDVLLQIHAAGVNPIDFKTRNGEFKLILPGTCGHLWRPRSAWLPAHRKTGCGGRPGCC